MPKDCNSLEIAPEKFHYCKDDCKWVKRKMGRPLKIDGRIIYSLGLDQRHLDEMKRIAKNMQISVSDLMRTTLIRIFPYYSQQDFTEKTNE